MSYDLVKMLRGRCNCNMPSSPCGSEDECRFDFQVADRIEELEAKLEELLAVSKRAVRLSLDHADFKLYAMEPMHQAIAAAELKGEDRG